MSRLLGLTSNITSRKVTGSRRADLHPVNTLLTLTNPPQLLRLGTTQPDIRSPLGPIPALLTFVPKSGQETKFPYDRTPTYLFRLYEPGSPGSSSMREVTTPVCTTSSNENCSDRMNLLELPPEEATKKLYHHLLWVYGHEHRCNLMSWSSSLLFVLQ